MGRHQTADTIAGSTGTASDNINISKTKIISPRDVTSVDNTIKTMMRSKGISIK